LPTIIDNRGDNTLLHALQRLLPGVQGLDITTGLFEIGKVGFDKKVRMVENVRSKVEKQRVINV